MKKGIFVSGTDTGVGKTVVSSLILSSLKSFGNSSGYFKPIQTGSDLDTPSVAELTGSEVEEFPSPVYQLALPAAPYVAAMHERKQIQIDLVAQKWNALDSKYWVVEGAGGLLVPLSPRHTIRDLIQALNLRLLIVSSTRLGTMNHTLLTVEAAKASQIPIAGIVLVGEKDPYLRSVLEEHSSVSVITHVPEMNFISKNEIQNMAKICFSEAIIQRIFE